MPGDRNAAGQPAPPSPDSGWSNNDSYPADAKLIAVPPGVNIALAPPTWQYVVDVTDEVAALRAKLEAEHLATKLACSESVALRAELEGERQTRERGEHHS